MIGVTAAITPRLLMVNTVLKLVRGRNVVSINLLGEDAETMELIAEEGSRITKGTLKDLDIPKGMVIGAILHDGNTVVPRGNAIIQPGDHVIVFALQSTVSAAEQFFASPAEAAEETP